MDEQNKGEKSKLAPERGEVASVAQPSPSKVYNYGVTRFLVVALIKSKMSDYKGR